MGFELGLDASMIWMTPAPKYFDLAVSVSIGLPWPLPDIDAVVRYQKGADGLLPAPGRTCAALTLHPRARHAPVEVVVLAYYLLMSHFTMKRFYIMFSGFLASGFIVVLWSFLALTKIKFLPASIEQYAPLSLIGTVSTLGIFVTVLVPLFITALYLVWNQTAMKQSTKYTLFSLIGVGLVGALYLMLALYPFLLDTKDSLAWMVPLGGIAFFLVYILAQIVRPPEQLTWVPMLVFVAVLAFLMIGTNSLVRATLPVSMR